MTGAGLNWNLYKAHLLTHVLLKMSGSDNNVISTQQTLRRCKALYEGSLPQAQTRTSISQTVTYWSYRDVLTCLRNQSQSMNFPRLASCLHLSRGWKTVAFETYLVQWNVGQSSCHDYYLGNR